MGAGVCWAGLAGLAFFEYLRQGPAGYDALGNFAELTVYAAGYTLVCLLLLPGLANVVVVGKGGVALERWGITRWHVPWAAVKGWRREQDTNGNLVGLCLVDQQGCSRRIGLGVLTLGAEYYEGLLTASQEHAPAMEELPEVKVFRLHPGCIVALVMVAFFLLLYLALAATGSL